MTSVRGTSESGRDKHDIIDNGLLCVHTIVYIPL